MYRGYDRCRFYERGYVCCRSVYPRYAWCSPVRSASCRRGYCRDYCRRGYF